MHNETISLYPYRRLHRFEENFKNNFPLLKILLQIHIITHCTSGILKLNLINSCQSLKFLNLFRIQLFIQNVFFVLKSLVNIEAIITSIDFEPEIYIYLLKIMCEI